ncbi:MAG: type II secretion system major pseudopilin GspG [Mariprofundaceae bacterium]|nr:type II secretion system major pseudopilin GspG [Mariprofundaceae bacterium]
MKNKQIQALRHKEQGFTLLEIMVVLIIIGVMAAIVAPRFIERADEAKVDSTKIQMKNIQQALKLYRLQKGHYPSSNEGLKALTSAKGGKTYLDEMPKDAWGNDFVYLSPGVHGDVDILSYGADGKSGGTDFDADIGNWEK